MNAGRTVFSQIMDPISQYQFQQCVARYGGDQRSRTFSTWSHFLYMAFAQLTGRESLREIVECLRAIAPRLYHAGIRESVGRSTLADANRLRDWRIFRDLAMDLVAIARQCQTRLDIAHLIEEPAYALDSTVVDLCLSLFPWAKHRKHKSAVKIHTQFDLQYHIPTIVHVTSGKVSDHHLLDVLDVEAGAMYIMDRGYNDFKRQYHIHQLHGEFIFRAKKDLTYRYISSIKRQESPAKLVTSTIIRADQRIRLVGPKSRHRYPEALRRVAAWVPDHEMELVLLTNNITLSALTITELYRERWKIELFFKWIKQHLHIKAFYGTSPNAVQIQIWVAICVYALIIILIETQKLKATPWQVLQILSLTLFEKTPIKELFDPTNLELFSYDNPNQLNLFN